MNLEGAGAQELKGTYATPHWLSANHSFLILAKCEEGQMPQCPLAATCPIDNITKLNGVPQSHGILGIIKAEFLTH